MKKGKYKSPSKLLDIEGDWIRIKFPFDPKLVTFVKTLIGRKYDSEGRQWFVPFNFETVKLLVDEYQFTTSDRLRKKLYKKELKRAKTIKLPKLLREPYPFQKIGIHEMIEKKGRVLLADDMGLGKTLQAIGWLAKSTKKKLPAIILCPASLKINWREELQKTLPDCPIIHVINGMNKDRQVLQDASIHIINFTIFSNSFETIITPDGKKVKKEIKGSGWADHLLKIKPKTIIIDEAHAIKNRDANRTRTILKFSKLKYKILLSGTPIEKRPVELWNLINFIDPLLFHNYYSFVFRYCGAKKTEYGLDVSGATNMGELHSILSKSLMIRRTKDQVGIELPKRMDSIINVEIDNLKEYKQAENQFKTWLGEKLEIKLNDAERQLAIDFGIDRKEEIIAEKVTKTMSAEMLVKIGVLKQLAAKGKLNALIDWLGTALGNEEKIVVFCTHTEPINILYKKFQKIAVKIDGSVAVEKRQAIVERFQTDPKVKLFFGNMKAAGVGFTLTAASNVVIFEFPDKPGEMTQAIDRINRIGQKSESINVWFFSAKDTIDEDLIESLNSAQKVVKNILDGVSPDDTILINNVLTRYLF